MTVERKFTWTCDSSTCNEESKVFHNEYAEQPVKWAVFNIVGGSSLHFCPSCAEAIKEVFKVKE